MHSPHIEERTVTSLVAAALDIAQQLDSKRGKAVVVCEHPVAIASLVGKKWHQLLRPLLRDYASTLDPHKRQELSQKIALMRSLVFSAVGKADQLETSKTDVLFCTAETLLRYSPICQAMYVTYPISHKELHLIYAQFCQQIAGRFIHHSPSDEEGVNYGTGNITRTVAAMKAAGIQVDDELCPRDTQRDIGKRAEK